MTPVSAVSCRPVCAFEHDQRADLVGRQDGRRSGHGRGHVLDRPLRRRRTSSQPQRSDPADAFEGPAQLGLEDDDERQQADHGAGLQDLRQQLQAERLGERRISRRGQ